MEVNTGHTRPLGASSVMVRPLEVRKASSQSHIARDQQTTSDQNSQRGSSDRPIHPPRTSSIRGHDKYSATLHASAACPKTLPVPLDSEEHSITTSGHGRDYRSYPAMDTQSTDFDSGRSTLSSTQSQYSFDASIMGNFVPIDSPNMAALEPEVEPPKIYLQNVPRRQAVKVNPYEFEPASPYSDSKRQTTFTDFIKQGQEVQYTYSPRVGHVKNAISEGNALYMAQNSNHLAVTPSKPNCHGLYRCESSPSINQIPFPTLRNATPNPDIPQCYVDPQETDPQSHRGRSEKSTPRGDQDVGDNYVYRSPQRRYQGSAQESRLLSPTRRSPQTTSSKGYTINRNLTHSPTKMLNNVNEGDEHEGGSTISNSPPPSPPKKRSRSPMKKMFGEHGWLGYSPDEKPDPRLLSKKGFVTHIDFANRPKKLGMMEKLKNKFEEMAEKADMSPKGRSRSNTTNSDKQRLSILSISLAPPEQARIYMELELMLVHTANNFLMNQFSQGRMDVDSIKKAVDLWKIKGRPVVIEFMYDQATQRDIVLANLQNFRFHGEKAGSDIRINSMLYNWKQVANHMVIRTFCNADTVILKLLFDIEQILELLGAGEPMMIRLQQIRTTSAEIMRVARHNNHVKANNQQSFRGREPPRASQSTVGGSILYNQPADDPYGGLKLVPDAFAQ